MSTTTSGVEPSPKRTRRGAEGTETEVNSTPQLSSLGLKEALEGILVSGRHADVIFIVGGGHEGQDQIGRREISAHKCILSGRSEIFGAMIEDRWNNGATSSVKDSSGENGNIVRIEIDPTINANAFEQIIKFIYNEDVSSCLRGLEFEDIFEFRSLAEMYGFIQLKDAASMKIAHDLVKDYRKCYLTLEHEIVDQDLRDVAFSVLKWSLAEALAANDMPLRWTEQIWEYVLSDEAITLEEILLFQGLWRWKEQDPSSMEEPFQKLVKLLRFPIMSSSDIFTVVRPTDVLSSDQLLNILQYQSELKTPITEKPKINFGTEKRGRKVKWVTNFKELMQAFDEIQVIEDEDGAVEIFLLPGDYSGVVDVNKDFVKLTGFGPYTILQGQESGIKISSNQTTLSNLTLQGTMTFFHVTGNCNSIKNIVGTISSPMFGLVVTGARNLFENFTFSCDVPSAAELEDYELDCEVKRTEFTAFLRGQGIELQLINDVTNLRFVWSDGPRNKFSHFECTHLKNRNVMVGIDFHTRFFVSKEDNVIQNVQFGEASSLFDEPSLSQQKQQPFSSRSPKWPLLFVYGSTGLRVADSCFTQIILAGDQSSHHQFKRVVAKTIVLCGFDHKFEDCRYEGMIDAGKNTVTTDCVTKWLIRVDTSLPPAPLG